MPPTGRPAGLDRRSPGVLPTVAAASPAYRFSGHQTFPFRYDWLPKAAEEAKADPWLFTRPDALARLGVGKNMVASIRHWCEAAGLMEIAPARKGGHARMTPLGELIFGRAPPNLGGLHPPPPPPPPPPRGPPPPPPPPEITRTPRSPVPERR